MVDGGDGDFWKADQEKSISNMSPYFYTTFHMGTYTIKRMFVAYLSLKTYNAEINISKYQQKIKTNINGEHNLLVIKYIYFPV